MGRERRNRRLIVAVLDDLRAARDALLMGKRAITVSSGGRSVTYAQPDLADVERRIRELENEAGAPRVSIVQVRAQKGWS